MSIFDNSWLWLLISGGVLILLFILIYLQEKFSKLNIIVLVFAIFTFLIAGVTGLFSTFHADARKLNRLFEREFVNNVNAQKLYINSTLDAVKKSGNSLIKVAKITAKEAPHAVKPFFKRATSMTVSTVLNPM